MTGTVSRSSPLGSDVMSSTIIVVFCPRVSEQTCCRFAAVFILILPDIIHFLHLQHLHHENHDELHKAGKKKQQSEQIVLFLSEDFIETRTNCMALLIRLRNQCPHQEPVDIHEQQCQEKSVEEEVERDARH